MSILIGESADMVRMGRQTRGEKHWHTKLSNEQVLEIFHEPRRMGVVPYLAGKYKISKHTVHLIRAGYSRKDITNAQNCSNHYTQQDGFGE